jgi:hypothetical protein
MQSDELIRTQREGRQSADRERGCVAREHDALIEHGFGLAYDTLLDVPLLENRLDDELATRESLELAREMNPLQRRFRIRCRASAARMLLGQQIGDARPRLVGQFHAGIEQHDLDARAGGTIGNAAAHHAGAQDPELAHHGLRHIRRAARELVGQSLVDEQCTHQVARHDTGHQLCEILGFDLQCGVPIGKTVPS